MKGDGADGGRRDVENGGEGMNGSLDAASRMGTHGSVRSGNTGVYDEGVEFEKEDVDDDENEVEVEDVLHRHIEASGLTSKPPSPPPPTSSKDKHKKNKKDKDSTKDKDSDSKNKAPDEQEQSAIEKENDPEHIRLSLDLLCDTRNHPVLIHSNKGKHRSGVLVACARKILMNWVYSSVKSEYTHFAGEKGKTDLEFIEGFECEVRYDARYKPKWLQVHGCDGDGGSELVEIRKDE